MLLVIVMLIVLLCVIDNVLEMSVSRAVPKSLILQMASLMSDSDTLNTRMFSSFRSRWMMFIECRYLIPRHISRPYLIFNPSLITCLLITSHNDPIPTYSITYPSCPDITHLSYTSMMNGLFNFIINSISLENTPLPSCLITFTATSFPLYLPL